MSTNCFSTVAFCMHLQFNNKNATIRASFKILLPKINAECLIMREMISHNHEQTMVEFISQHGEKLNEGINQQCFFIATL